MEHVNLYSLTCLSSKDSSKGSWSWSSSHHASVCSSSTSELTKTHILPFRTLCKLGWPNILYPNASKLSNMWTLLSSCPEQYQFMLHKDREVTSHKIWPPRCFCSLHQQLLCLPRGLCRGAPVLISSSWPHNVLTFHFPSSLESIKPQSEASRLHLTRNSLKMLDDFTRPRSIVRTRDCWCHWCASFASQLLNSCQRQYACSIARTFLSLHPKLRAERSIHIWCQECCKRMRNEFRYTFGLDPLY